MNTKEYIRRVMQLNNEKLIEYFKYLLSNIESSGEGTSTPEEIDIELAIQQDKSWQITISQDILEAINQDKNWEVSQ